MRRVLWICNIMLPAIAGQLGLPYSSREGWLTGLFEQLAGGRGEITLGICFPVERQEEQRCITVQKVACYGFAEDLNTPEKYEPALEQRFGEIYQDFKPDILHIFGTEFPHALAAARAFGRPKRTLIGMQGLCCEIARVYRAGLPEKVWNRVTLRDLLRQDSLKQQQQKFQRRGENEKEALLLTGHITGRTRFDREGTAAVNPQAIYHAMNETMRSSFYQGAWRRENCRPGRIFLGQGDYPLKGFHFLLEAMPAILKKHPEAEIYVAGNSIIAHRTLKDKLKLSAYGSYLLERIRACGLQDKVVVLGRLSEQEMKKQFLQAAVFVCPSILENSPNSVAEAMLLGVPVVASRTGGIPDMLTHEREGLLFEPGNSQELAQAINRMLDTSDDLANRLSAAAGRRARMAHDGETNFRRLLEIYDQIGAEA